MRAKAMKLRLIWRMQLRLSILRAVVVDVDIAARLGVVCFSEVTQKVMGGIHAASYMPVVQSSSRCWDFTCIACLYSMLITAV